jgi:hypothetical protein
MEYVYTKHQVTRGAMADAEDGNKMYLFKNVSFLRATYQIRLLAYRAITEGRKLIIRIPKHCKVDKVLRDLIKENKKHLKLERV